MINLIQKFLKNKNKLYIAIFVGFLVVLVGLGVTFYFVNRSEPTKPATPSILVSIPTQKGILAQFVEADVRVVLPPNSKPESFQITNELVETLASASIYLAVGTFAFETDLIQELQARNPELKVHYFHSPTRSTQGPYIWLDPLRVVVYAQSLAYFLSPYFGPEPFETGFPAFKSAMVVLHRQFASLPNTTSFCVAQPVFGHLASRYGFTQIALDSAHTDPTFESIPTLKNTLVAHQTQPFFLTPQMTNTTLPPPIQELDLAFYLVDPLDENVFGMFWVLVEGLSGEG